MGCGASSSTASSAALRVPHADVKIPASAPGPGEPFASTPLQLASTPQQRDDGAFPRSGVRLAWLRQFVDACKGNKYTWTAKDFLKAEHGGGADEIVQITTDNLMEHRTRMNAAGKDGDGKPTNVKYVDIPFELMTTNDVCFGIVKPATEQVKTSYAEMLSNTQPREVQKATVFVSHAWKYTFVNVVDALSKCLRECLRVVRRVHR